MFKTQKTKGFVIKKEDLGEADRILTIYTDKLGKVRAKAKGVRWINSKLAGQLEEFNLVNFVLVKGKGGEIITSARVQKYLSNIPKNFYTIGLAFYGCELINLLIPSLEPDLKIFNLLFGFLDKLNSKQKDLNKETHIFALRLLGLLGYLPEFTFCSDCKKRITGPGYLDLGGSKIFCSNCLSNKNKTLEISSVTIRSIQNVQIKRHAPLKFYSLQVRKELNLLIQGFLDILTEEKPKVPDVFKATLTFKK